MMKKNEFNVIWQTIRKIWFQSGDFAKSLSVTYTYSLYNPDDDMMKKNMEYYRNHENSRAEMFVNNDVPPHIAAYDQGK